MPDGSPATPAGADLSETSNHLAMALAACRMVAWEWDVHADRVTTTGNLIEIYGTPSVEESSQGFGMVHPEDRDRHQTMVTRAIETGEPYVSQFRIIRPDTGAVVWLEERATSIRNAEGTVDRLAGVVMDITERKLAHDILDGHASLLDLTFDAVLVREFTTDTIEFWNRGAEELYGFGSDEAIGRVSHDLLQTIHTVSVKEAKEILLRTGRWEGELTHTRQDGSKVVVSSRWAVRMDHGQPVSILETNTDISEQRAAETRLRLSEERFRTIVSTAGEGIWLVSGRAQTLYANKRMATMLGCTTAELSEKSVLEFTFPEDTDAHRKRVGENITGSVEHFETRFRRADGSELLVLGSTSPMLDARGSVIGALGMFTDITERVHGERQRIDLLRSEEQARLEAEGARNALAHLAAEQAAILAQMADGVAIVDADGKMTFLNDSARRLTGREPGKTIEDIFRRGDVFLPDGTPFPFNEMPIMRALHSREAVNEARWRITGAEGREIIVEGSAAPVLDEAGALLGAVATFRDVTAQAELEQQKDDFLAAATHDLRTPLTVIRGMTQLLQRRITRNRGIEPEAVLEGLARIEQSTARMTSLIEDLVDLTRLQSGTTLELRRRPTDIVALAAHCVEETRQTYGEDRLTLECEVQRLVGAWDAIRIERVILNLLSNAVKYSEAPKPILVRVFEAREDTGRSWAAVSVTDQGIGIPEADMDRIFLRFRRGSNVGRDTFGTGIGLSGAKQIVEQHGGQLEVSSVEGAGSTFTLKLPAS